MKTVAWTTGLLGVWLALVAFFGFGRVANAWNDWIVGATALTLGLVLAQAGMGWQGWLATLAGTWLVIMGFLAGAQAGSGLVWNNLLVGLALALGGFAALRGPTARQSGERSDVPNWRPPSV